MPASWAPLRGGSAAAMALAFELRALVRGGSVSVPGLAMEAGTSRATVYAVLNGTRLPSPELLDALLRLEPPRQEGQSARAFKHQLSHRNGEIRAIYRRLRDARLTPSTNEVEGLIRRVAGLRKRDPFGVEVQRELAEKARTWPDPLIRLLVNRLAQFETPAGYSVGYRAGQLAATTARIADVETVLRAALEVRDATQAIDLIEEFARAQWFSNISHVAPENLVWRVIRCVVGPEGSPEDVCDVLSAMVRRGMRTVVAAYLASVEAFREPDRQSSVAAALAARELEDLAHRLPSVRQLES